MANKEASLLLRIKTAGEEALSKITFTFGDMVNLAKSLGNALALPIQKIADTELATKSLTQALINNGIYSKELKENYINQANALAQLSLYEGDEIMTAQASLQQQIGNVKITKELTQAILDFATAQKMDLKAAADLVGKSIGTNMNALSRYGIQINTAASESEKMAAITQGLSNKFGGQAQVATEGLGVLQMLHKSFLGLAEGIGQRIAPAITLAANAMLEFSDGSSSLKIVLDGIGATVKFVITSVFGLVEVFQFAGKLIGGSLATIVETMSNISQGNFSAAWQSIKTGASDTYNELTTDFQAYKDRVQQIWKEGNQEENLTLQEDEKMLEQSLDRRAELVAAKRDEMSLKKFEKDAEDRQFEMDQMAVKHQEDMAMLIENENEKALALENANLSKLQLQIKHEDDLIKNATTTASKLASLKKKERLQEALEDSQAKKNEIERQVQQDKLKEQNRRSTLATISTLQQSNDEKLLFLGRAAAITQIAIDTPVAVGRALAAFPPPANFAAAGLVAAAMAAQAARIAGVQLAEGGVVLPRPGGTQAIIGEAGSAEAVIPLDKYPGLTQGGNVTVQVYGGLLGDESSAYEFAKAVDRELLKLRRNNDSVSFDSGVI